MRIKIIFLLALAIGLPMLAYVNSNDETTLFFKLVDQEVLKQELNFLNMSLKPPFEFHRIEIFRSTKFFRGITYNLSGHQNEFNCLVNIIDRKDVIVIPTVYNGITVFDDNLRSPCLIAQYNKIIVRENIAKMNCTKAVELANSYVQLADSQLSILQTEKLSCDSTPNEWRISASLLYASNITTTKLFATFTDRGWLLRRNIVQEKEEE